MSNHAKYKRYPAIRCRVKHLIEGIFSDNEKALYTIFGKLKRVRVVGTIVDKHVIEDPFDQTLIFDAEKSNTKIEFDLNDDTGTIKVILWNVKINNYDDIKKGNIVDVFGIIRKTINQEITVNCEIINKKTNPNFILLHNAKIEIKIKNGNICKIPELEEIESKSDIITILDEIDIESLFVDDFEENETKEYINDNEKLTEDIYFILKKEKKAMHISELSKKLGKREIDIRTSLSDLILSCKIYQSEEKKYEIY